MAKGTKVRKAKRSISNRFALGRTHKNGGSTIWGKRTGKYSRAKRKY